MNKFYFTFGQVHRTKTGIPLKDFYVTVIASSHNKAIEIFEKEFTSKYMDSIDRYATSYTENNFKSHFFPNGEFKLLKEN